MGLVNLISVQASNMTSFKRFKDIDCDDDDDLISESDIKVWFS